jgi:hypothetical protein
LTIAFSSRDRISQTVYPSRINFIRFGMLERGEAARARDMRSENEYRRDPAYKFRGAGTMWRQSKYRTLA